MGECIQQLATKYTRTKFVKIISNDCIPNYPDRNLPTLLIYKDTECKHNLVGKAPFGGRLSVEGELLIIMNHAYPGQDVLIATDSDVIATISHF
jgi:hypothetical protein